ncbi:hypothetical protein [Rhizobium sp. WW_1]|jgi:chromosome segregation ATPase|uniref:hypothetical protein n=1 Tax=Rhizobium sp. WW_1 TaxID=1907375 RepID=UPI000647845A|nr:hypothetical protein [Rhizobium sp. WW_1]RKD61652.1 hypothetical protein BJ928_107254 [Rhizobium sp. WW_1]
MADIQDVIIPYELLVRFGPDAAPTGAHVQYLRRVTLDGEIIKDDVQPPQPVDLAGFPTGAIMTDTTRDALAKVTSQAAQIATLSGQLDIVTAELTKANADLAAVTADVTQLRTELTDAQQAAIVNDSALKGQLYAARDQLGAANATIQQLENTIKQMQAAPAPSAG